MEAHRSESTICRQGDKLPPLFCGITSLTAPKVFNDDAVSSTLTLFVPDAVTEPKYNVTLWNFGFYCAMILGFDLPV